jgi:Secretion system C-terminal sorting domain
MKKHSSKKALWLSFLSVVTLGIFILLAVGSWAYVPPAHTVQIGKGLWQETYFTRTTKRVTTGKHDAQGRWVGNVKSVWTMSSTHVICTEEATMLYGMREGPCTVTYEHKKPETYIYHQDEQMPKLKYTQRTMADTSGYQILYNRFPWFLISLDAFGFDSMYMKAFIDTIEIMLNAYQFESAEFDDYYQNVLDDLEETPYDSVIAINSDFFLTKGLEEIKNAEIRLAVIDRYRSESSTTYEIVNTTYPGYLHTLNDSAITNQDFEAFCQDLDSCMDSYGVLDPEDTVFIDTLDVRLLRALYAIINVEDSTSASMKRSVKGNLTAYRMVDFKSLPGDIKNILKPLILKSSPAQVGTVVVSLMLPQFIKGDILRRAVRESWSNRNGIIRIPTAATVFSDFNSATSVTLRGYVLDDGGSALRASGITWATFYNPTIDDHMVTHETGTAEDFTVRLRGLTEGTTYYARTYATNTAGIAYGNCISFVATAPSDMANISGDTRDLIVYPNPASAVTTFSFQLESQENMVLTILDMKGQVVFNQDYGRLPRGNNQINVDLSGLPDGAYTCLLTNGDTKVSRKFVIAR